MRKWFVISLVISLASNGLATAQNQPEKLAAHQMRFFDGAKGSHDLIAPAVKPYLAPMQDMAVLPVKSFLAPSAVPAKPAAVKPRGNIIGKAQVVGISIGAGIAAISVIAGAAIGGGWGAVIGLVLGGLLGWFIGHETYWYLRRV